MKRTVNVPVFGGYLNGATVTVNLEAGRLPERYFCLRNVPRCEIMLPPHIDAEDPFREHPMVKDMYELRTVYLEYGSIEMKGCVYAWRDIDTVGLERQIFMHVVAGLVPKGRMEQA